MNPLIVRAPSEDDQAAQAALLKRAHRALKFWGVWLQWQNDPGVGYPPANLLSKIMKRGDDFWLDDHTVDWSEAEQVDRCVTVIGVASPDIKNALICRYEWVDGMDRLPKRARQWAQLQRWQKAHQREISGSRFRSLLADGRKMVASCLALNWLNS